jgi:Heterokaryon incompatibility protein (HET)
MLCSVCLDALRNPFTPFNAERDGPLHRSIYLESGEQAEPKWFASGPHHASLDSLRASISKQCHICLEIWKVVSRKQIARVDEISAETGRLSVCDISYLPRARGVQGVITFRQSEKDFRSMSDIISTDWEYSLELRMTAEMGIKPAKLSYVDFDGTWHAGEKNFPDETENEQVRVASEWLRECEESHAECAGFAHKSTRLPSRLVRVNEQQDPLIQIVDSRNTDISGTYTTLSYCWGLSTAFTLLSTNIDQMKAGIPVQSLPKTLRDAVTFTRKLKIPYLWVDSLCIIQDSEQDWQSEATDMANVYGHAYCNLAATHSQDCNGGLFWNQNPDTVRPIVITPSLQPHFEEPLVLFDEDLWNKRIKNAPLNKRGWVLQERTMASRTIHFTYDQILWECHQTRKSQYFPTALPGEERGKWPRVHGLQAPQTSDEKRDLTLLWNSLVRTYTNCHITRPEDKLVAIGATAAHIHSQTGDEYCAGLWRQDMPRNLAWLPWPARGKHPAVYRAPSWSWASVDGAVPNDSPYFEELIPLVDIISCTVSSVNSSRFGPVKDAQLRLSGRLFSITAWRKREAWGSEWLGHFITGGSTSSVEGSPRRFGMEFCDVDFPAEEKLDLYLLPLFIRTYDYISGSECLVLREKNGAYCRFGVCSYNVRENETSEYIEELDDLLKTHKETGKRSSWLLKSEPVILI